MTRTARLSLLLLIGAMAPACYKYTPVQSPERGMEVRARLEPEAAARRSQDVDDPVLHYDGTVVDFGTDALVLDVLVARSSSAFQSVTIRDTITLHTAEIRSITRRTLSATRSTLFALGVGAAAVAIALSVDAIVGGTGPGDDNGPPPAMRVPVLTWRASHLLPALSAFRE